MALRAAAALLCLVAAAQASSTTQCGTSYVDQQCSIALNYNCPSNTEFVECCLRTYSNGDQECYTNIKAGPLAGLIIGLFFLFCVAPVLLCFCCGWACWAGSRQNRPQTIYVQGVTQGGQGQQQLLTQQHNPYGPQQGGYPPQQGGYPPQQGYPPQGYAAPPAYDPAQSSKA